jgi:alkylated DNA repair protein alkB family protein 8
MESVLTENSNNNLETTYVKEVYEEIAPHFSNTRSYKWSWVIDFLDSLKTDSIVYDLGCGNGRNMDHGSLKFIGIDNCENFVSICKNKNLSVINSNITKIPLNNNSADAIICIAVFHHLSSTENRIKSLLEMKRLVKPGGKILISTWSINQPQKTRRTFNNYGNNIVLWNSYGKLYERYYYIFKLDEIKELIKRVGLIILNYDYSCGNEIFTLMKI